MRAQGRGRDRAMQLGQLALARFKQQQVMVVLGLRQAKQALQRNLGGGAGGDVAPAYHAIDLGRSIVDHHRQLVADRAIAAADQRIAERRYRILAEVLARLIAHRDHAVIKQAAQRFAAGAPAAHRHGPSAIAVVVRPAAIRRASAEAVKVGATGGRGIEAAEVGEAVERRRVLGVQVVLVHDSIPVEPEPSEVGDHRRRKGGRAALPVEVFKPQQHRAALRPRVEPAQQRGEQRAGVGRASGGGRKAAEAGHGLALWLGTGPRQGGPRRERLVARAIHSTVSPMFRAPLLCACCLLGAAAAEDILITDLPTRWRLSGEGVDLGAGETMGLVGVHVDVFPVRTALPGLYLGPGGYGAISGNRGGFFVFGGSLGWRQPLGGGFAIDVGGFAGGGGGASAAQGGGLMLRGQALACYDLGRLDLQAGVARIEFPNGDIASTDAVIGFAVRDDVLLAWPAAGRTARAATLAAAPTRIAPLAMVYLPDGGVRTRSGERSASAISLVGIALDRYLGDSFHLPLEIVGAADGAPGYMAVLGGIGWMQPLGARVYLDAELMVGAGGGGDVDTGGGLLLQPMLSFGVRLGHDLGLAVGGGRTWAPDGDFAATTVHAALEWMPERLDIVPSLSSEQRAVVPRDGLRLDPWTLAVLDKVYRPGDDVVTRGGGAQEEDVHLVGLGLEKPLAPWITLTGRAYSAFVGGVGGYSEGMFGARFHLPLGRVALSAHAEGGAGGGGGMDTGGGLIAQGTLGARWRVHGPFTIFAEAGRMQAHEGSFVADVLALGVAVDLARPLWR